MASVNIFDKYGIKEVANVYFEALENDESANVYKGDIVLFLDTLKVSTIETTAENVAAQGGWGNPRLIMWDYGKEINLTLEDALISLESLRFMMGGAIKTPTTNESIWVRHTEEVTCIAGGVMPVPADHLTGLKYNGQTGQAPAIIPSVQHPVRLINLTTGKRTKLTSGTIGSAPIIFKNEMMGLTSDGQATVEGDRIRIFWEEEVTTSSTQSAAVEVTISPSTFPGTYKVVGDTFMRSEKTGRDEPFQFIINKAKVQSEVTITLEAEGDPSTFEMTLNVLRDGDEMMKLVRYNLGVQSDTTSGDDIGSVGSSTL